MERAVARSWPARRWARERERSAGRAGAREQAGRRPVQREEIKERGRGAAGPKILGCGVRVVFLFFFSFICKYVYTRARAHIYIEKWRRNIVIYIYMYIDSERIINPLTFCNT